MPKNATTSRAQRSSMTSASVRKTRSQTSTSHSGSRVEPSHLVEKKRAKATKKKTSRAAKR